MGLFRKKRMPMWRTRIEKNTTLVISPAGNPTRFVGKLSKPKAISLAKVRLARTNLR